MSQVRQANVDAVLQWMQDPLSTVGNAHDQAWASAGTFYSYDTALAHVTPESDVILNTTFYSKTTRSIVSVLRDAMNARGITYATVENVRRGATTSDLIGARDIASNPEHPDHNLPAYAQSTTLYPARTFPVGWARMESFQDFITRLTASKHVFRQAQDPRADEQGTFTTQYTCTRCNRSFTVTQARVGDTVRYTHERITMCPERKRK